MPGYTRWSARPRLYREGEDGSTAYLTIGAMTEERQGGTLPGEVAPDGRWTADAWAPLEGFVANAGIRMRFGD